MSAMRCQLTSASSAGRMGAAATRSTALPAFRGSMAASSSIASSSYARQPNCLRPASISERRLVPEGRRGVQCQGLFGLGLPEIAVIAGIAALVFGPSKLPELGRGLGQTVKSFQTAAKEFETELKQAAATDEEKKPEEKKPEDPAAKK